jgi:4-hydroxy-tetrahydrodipicolinate reductase
MEFIHHTQNLMLRTTKTLPRCTVHTELNDSEQAKQNSNWSKKGTVPGTHTVTYNSEVDAIEIKHTAHNREGFALGAVIAAEWIVGKQGVFTMKMY